MMLLLPMVLLAMPPQARELERPALCRSAAYCAFMAREALLDGDLGKAARAGALQLHFEECREREGPRTAADTLARIELERGAPLRARLWLGAGGQEATRQAVAAALARLPPEPGPGGVYEQYLRAGILNSVHVRPAGPDRIQFSLDASRLSGRWCEDLQGAARGDHSYVVAAVGGMEGEARRQGDAYVYVPEGAGYGPCEMRFRFTGDSLAVVQEGSSAGCGFGAGVDAAGEYQRTSREAPPRR
jgi:hypothetical protein